MSLGTLTIVDEKASVGPIKTARITLVGDGAYPAGGSMGFRAAFNAAAGESRDMLTVQPSGINGDTHLEYQPCGPQIQVASVTPSTDLISSGAVLHGLSAGDGVRFRRKRAHDADHPDPVLPAGIVEGTLYFVIASGLTTTAFKISATSGGSAIDLTTAGSGDFEFRKEDLLFVRVMSTGVESAVSNQSGTTYGLTVTSY